MALSFNGSGQYLTQGSAIPPVMPFTMACWFNPTSTASAGTLMSVSSNSSANYYMMYMAAGGSMRAQTATAGVVTNASYGTALIAGAWYHCAVVFESATSRYVYVNGVSGHNGISNAGGVVNVTAVGANFNGSSTATNFLNGSTSYPTIWNVALSQADISNLYNAGAGIDPNTIQSASIVSFSLLQGAAPFPDNITSSNWTVTGTPAILADPFSISSSVPTLASIGDPRFGFCTHFGATSAWPISIIPAIAATGVGLIRDDCSWHAMTVSPGVYGIDAKDDAWINAAATNGMQVVVIAGGNVAFLITRTGTTTNGSAIITGLSATADLTGIGKPVSGAGIPVGATLLSIQSGSQVTLSVAATASASVSITFDDQYNPTQMSIWAAWFATQYAGKVAAIEIANEPNNITRFNTTSGKVDYETLINTVAAAVKATGTGVSVIGCGYQGGTITAMLPLVTMDGVVYHPYDPGNGPVGYIPEMAYEPPYQGIGSYVQWVGVLQGTTTLPIWETEWGAYCNAGFSQDNQACYLTRRLLMASALNVEHTFIYEYQDNGTELYGVTDVNKVQRASYGTVARLISALDGVTGSPASVVTISNVANGNTTDAKAYAYQGYGKTVISCWFGNHSPAFPPAASTATLKFPVGAYNAATVIDPVAGTSIPLSTYTTSIVGNSLTVSGFPISDHPLLITLTDSVPANFIQRAVNHVTGSGSIQVPVTTALTGNGNLIVVYIGTQSTGSVISSVTDNQSNLYSLAYSITSYNASLLCYNCLGCKAGVNKVTVTSAAAPASLNLDVAVYEFSAGAVANWFFDVSGVSGSNSGGSTSVSSGPSPATSQVNEVVIAACAATGSITTAGTAGWTGSVMGTNGWSEFETVSSQGAYAASFTVSATGKSWVSGVGTWYALSSSTSSRPQPKSTSSSKAVTTVTQITPNSEAFVQQAQNSVANSGAITCSVSISATQTGNLIVVYAGTLSSASVISSVTDNKGNVYSLAFSDTAFNASLFCYHCLGCIAGVTTVTVQTSASVSANQLDVSVYEMSGTGIWAFDKFSVAGSNSGASTTVSSGATAATTVPNEVIIAACFANGTSVTAGTAGWTGQGV